MFDPPPPRLLQALIASLLIHAAILLGATGLLPARPDTPAATMTVVVNGKVVRATSAPASKPSPVASVLRPPAAPGGAKTRQLFVEHSTVIAPAPPSAPAIPVEPAIPSPAVVAKTSEASGAQVSPATNAPTPPRDGLNANDLRQYRLSLAIAARRFKRYPPLAKERGWEGTVELALTVSAHRPEPEVSLVRSSGHAALDRQAEEMMVQAARASALPESLVGRNFRVLLPVQFSLDADQ